MEWSGRWSQESGLPLLRRWYSELLGSPGFLKSKDIFNPHLKIFISSRELLPLSFLCHHTHVCLRGPPDSRSRHRLFVWLPFWAAGSLSAVCYFSTHISVKQDTYLTATLCAKEQQDIRELGLGNTDPGVLDVCQEPPEIVWEVVCICS